MIATLTSVESLPAARPGALRAIGARNFAGAIIGGLLIAAIEFAITRGSAQFSFIEQLAWLARLGMHWVLAALPLGWVFGRLELHAAGRVPSGIAYAGAIAAGAVTGAVIMALHGKYIDPAISEIAVGFDLALADRFLYGLWQLGFWGTVGASLHAVDLRHRRSANALRQGELARLRTERRLAEMQLAAVHAQVEPEFVLATLDTVEQLYTRDIDSADRVLDALIMFLREATPLLRRQMSTVALECRLLETYSRVFGAAQEPADTTSIAVEPAARDVAMPPGILVSLAQAIRDDCFTRTASFAVRARTRGDACELDLAATAHLVRRTQALRDFVARAAQRLALTNGPRSSITVLHEDPRQFTLRIGVSHRGDDHVESTPR
jgi:hypothetical protein